MEIDTFIGKIFEKQHFYRRILRRIAEYTYKI